VSAWRFRRWIRGKGRLDSRPGSPGEHAAAF
jgi:hypothetical protein